MALRAHLICLKLSLAAIPSSTKLCQPTQFSYLVTPSLERIVTVMEEVWQPEIIGKERSIFACGSEIIWSTINGGSSRAFHLASYYRPPYSSQEVLEHFLDSFNSIFVFSNHHPNIVAAGDFNLKGINLWTVVSSAINQATSAQHNRPLPFMEEFSLTHHVKCPTRPAFEKTLDLLFLLYYYMRNFCNLIGLEQWYFSLIWNTYMWKLQILCG